MNETELKNFLKTLHSNLNILREREAKYGGVVNVPLALLNQITDYETAIEWVYSRLANEISAEELRKRLAPLNLSLDRGGTEIIAGDKVEGGKTTVLNLFNLPWQWIIGVLLLAGVIWATTIYGPNLYHWYINRATDDEILILLANFNDESENTTYDATTSIEQALRAALVKENDLADVRLVRLNQTFKRNKLEAVKALGKQYNATLFIWGHYDDGGMFPRFTILQEEKLKILPEGPEDKLVNLASPPDDFTVYVNRKLPDQMTYFTLFTVGQIFYLEGSYPDALRFFEDAVKSAETTETEAIRNSLAAIYFYKGYIYEVIKKDAQQALADYNKAIELDPHRALAYNNRGNVYYAQGDFKRALADLNKAIELDPNLALAYNNQGAVYYDQGDFERALADLNKAIELDPNLALAYNNRGLAYYELKNYNQAIADYTKAIELNHDPLAWPYNNRGRVHYAQDAFEQAITDFTKAIELDSNYATAYNNRGLAYYELKNYNQAIADYTKAIELNHDPLAWPYNNRGNAYREKGDDEQAITDYNKALDLDSNYATAYNNRGLTYYDQGDFEQALADYNKAIELDPNYALAYNNRGLAYQDSGKPVEAIADFERYLKLAPDAANREKVMKWIEDLKD